LTSALTAAKASPFGKIDLPVFLNFLTKHSNHEGINLLFCLYVHFFHQCYAQDSLTTTQDPVASQTTEFSAPANSGQQKEIPPKSMYTIKWKSDGPIIGAGFGLSALGLYLIQNKDDLTEAELMTKRKTIFLSSTGEMQDIMMKKQMTRAIYRFLLRLHCR
jgi:hypothetical protein